MKKTFFILLIFALFGGRSLAQEGWKIGVEAAPTLFWLYNADDWKTDALTIGNDPLLFSPNGIQTGISVKRDLNEHFEASAGLLYTYGKQKYHFLNNPTGTITQNAQIYKDDLYIEMEHIKMPLSVTAFLYEEGSTPFVQIGVVPTYLIGLMAHQEHIGSNTAAGFYERLITNTTLSDITIITKDNGKEEVTNQYNIKQFTYTDFSLEALLAIGYKINVSDNIDIRAQLTGTVSILNAETTNKYRGIITYHPSSSTPTTLINAGLSISANYIF